MKKLFLGMAAVALLASCSNDEIIEQSPKTPISFKSFVDKSTRATDVTTTATMDKFQVWGLMRKEEGSVGEPFEGVTVSGSDLSDGKYTNWTYDIPVYWESGYKYSFNAIAPATGTIEGDTWEYTKPIAIGGKGSIKFTNGKGMTDLVCAYDGTFASEAYASGAKTIDFTFSHLLSRVKFSFANGMTDGSEINVTDVKITNATKIGTIDLDNNSSWSVASDNADNELSFGNVKLDAGVTSYGNALEKETDHLYMIPAHADSKYKVDFTVTRTFNGVTETYEHKGVELTNLTLAAASSYDVKAELTSSTIDQDGELHKIEFTVTKVNEWDDNNWSGVTMQ